MLTDRPIIGNRENPHHHHHHHPQFCRRPEAISTEHPGTSLQLPAGSSWLRSHKNLPSPVRRVSRLRARSTGDFMYLYLGLPFPPGQSLGDFPCPVPQCHKARNTVWVQSVLEPRMPDCIPNPTVLSEFQKPSPSCCLPLFCLLVSHSSPVPAIQIKAPQVPPASPDS